MAYNKKYAELGESVIDYVNHREDAIEYEISRVDGELEDLENNKADKTYVDSELSSLENNVKNKFEIIDSKFILPPLTEYKYIPLGNLYPQSFQIIEELNRLYISIPDTSSTSHLRVYNLNTLDLIQSSNYQIGHGSSITYNSVNNKLYVTDNSNASFIREINPSNINEMVQKTSPMLSSIAYDSDKNIFWGMKTNGGSSVESFFKIIKMNSNLDVIETIDFTYPKTFEKFWVQDITYHNNSLLLVYTYAKDSDKAKHGLSGVAQVSLVDFSIQGDYTISHGRNTYFETEGIQVIGNKVYIGAISNNYEYSSGNVGYEIMVGDLTLTTPNISLYELDGLNLWGVLHQIYYDRNYTGEQYGTPNQPYNNFRDLFKNTKFENIEIVLLSDVTENLTFNYYNNINYLIISGDGDKKIVSGVWDFRGIKHLKVINIRFNQAGYWGTVIVRSCLNVEFNSCVFNDTQTLTNPGVGCINSKVNITGCEFINCRHGVVVNTNSVANITDCTGNVREVAWLMGGVVFLSIGSLVSESPSRGSKGVVYQ